MSAAPGMTKQEEVLFEQVYIPAMVKTCAARGITFGSREELNEFIDIAAMVDAQISVGQTSVIKQAHQTLKRQLGVDKAEASEAAATTVKSAADELLKRPEILEALLVQAK